MSMADPSHVFINPSFSLADASVEENKVVQYKRKYASINVKVLGLAMNLAGGGGGPNIVEGNQTLFGDCCLVAECLSGRIGLLLLLLVLGCRGWFRLFRLRMLTSCTSV